MKAETGTRPVSARSHQEVDYRSDSLKARGDVNLDRTPDDELLSHLVSSG
jgi:hypothetical protein